MESIEIEVDVNEAFIGRVHPGMAVSAVLDAYPDWTIPASVIGIVATANREKATVKVRIGMKEMPQPNASVATPAAPRATSTPEAPPPPVQSPAGQHLSTTETAALVTRGDAFLSAGDTASARLFYERAASGGNSVAALRLGTTFDPNFLGRTGVHGRSLPPAGNPPPSVAPPQPAPQSAAALPPAPEPPKPQGAPAVPTPAPWRPEQRDPRILPDMAVKVTFDDIGAPAEKSAAVN
jgi:hypothetical protein